jgi:predicted nuclease with TOPRIM domain
MSTDITALMATMKAAALKAKQANDLYLEGKITLAECVAETKDYLDYSDNPNNVLALVEALETKDTEIEWMRKRIEELAKALEVSENHRATWYEMADKLGDSLDVSEKRVAELESRTVKLPNQAEFDDPLSAYEAIEKCKEALAAAGIQIIEGEGL